MIHAELLNDAAMKKLLRIYPENSFLFKQGEKGNTMFILIEGQVVLTQKTLNVIRVVEIVGPGDVLGEKAILSDQPYKRGLSAQAKSEVALLEFDQKSLQVVHAKMPQFVMQMLRMVTRRLDKSNELVSILQLGEPAERLAQFLIFTAKHNGKRVSQGVQLPITLQQIQSNLHLPEAYIKSYLEQLAKNNILLPKGHDTYVLTDENALISFIAVLKERIAA